MKIEFPTLISSAPSIRERLPEPEAVIDACVETAGAPHDGLFELFGRLGAPPLDMAVTVMSARACLLAAREGRAFYHHELRGRIPMPPALEPEIQVWAQGTVPVWEDGVLAEPKYFSFFQDAPFAAFNPNHRRKWRSHELLHGALGFFWSPEMTRFEMYVGARLNELVPVVHWYGLDEIFRPRCFRHQGEVLYREWCRDCEAAAVPFWEAELGGRSAAVQFVRNSFEHFVREYEACLAEIETGEVHETPRGRLNASSDSVGYLKGHWNRSTAWSFGSWVESFLVEGVDYEADLRRYAARVEQLMHALVSGSLEIDHAHFEHRRMRRILQDLGYRAFLALEWLDESTPEAKQAEDALMPALEQAADACRAGLDAPEPSWLDEARHVAEAVVSRMHEVASLFPKRVARPFDALGYTFDEQEGTSTSFRDSGFEISQVQAGLSTALPQTFTAEISPSLVQRFIESPHFKELGRIGTRFADWLSSIDHPKADLARFEAWAADDPRVDHEAESFGVSPAGASDLRRPARIRLNETYRHGQFPAEVVRDLVETDTDTVELAGAFLHGELRLVVVDATMGRLLDALQWDTPVEDEDVPALLELIDAGLVVWLPLPN